MINSMIGENWKAAYPEILSTDPSGRKILLGENESNVNSSNPSEPKVFAWRKWILWNVVCGQPSGPKILLGENESNVNSSNPSGPKILLGENESMKFRLKNW